MTGADRPMNQQGSRVTEATPIHLTEIGMLALRDEVWRLTYTDCGHVQDLPRYGLEREQAVHAVRRDYRHCMICAPHPWVTRRRRADH